MNNEAEMREALEELLEASIMAADPVPPKNASCHVGLVPQERCCHCSELIRLHEAIDRAKELLS